MQPSPVSRITAGVCRAHCAPSPRDRGGGAGPPIGKTMSHRSYPPPVLRILVADDDGEMRAWLRLAVRPLACAVVEAASGAELLDRLADGDVDVVVTDLRMPAPNGLAAIASARAAGVTIPVLVITAFPDANIARAVANIDRALLLPKPFDVGELREAIGALMAKKSA